MIVDDVTIVEGALFPAIWRESLHLCCCVSQDATETSLKAWLQSQMSEMEKGMKKVDATCGKISQGSQLVTL